MVSEPFDSWPLVSMATITRSRTADDQMRELENKIQDVNQNCYKQMEIKQAALEDKIIGKMDQLISLVAGCEARIEACNVAMDDKINTKFSDLIKNSQKLRTVGRDGEILVDKSPLLPTPMSVLFKTNQDKDASKRTFSHPKVELTHFKGEDPRSWIRKCNKFFMFHQVSDALKCELVEMYLEGKADNWFQSVKFVKGNISWLEICEALIKRFDRKGGIDEHEEFNKLVQSGTVMEYVEKFEELKFVLLCKNSHLGESYFVSRKNSRFNHQEA